MSNWTNILLLAAMAAAAITVLAGFANLLRSGDPVRSQTLMRWRVGLQLVAVAIIAAILLFGH